MWKANKQESGDLATTGKGWSGFAHSRVLIDAQFPSAHNYIITTHWLVSGWELSWSRGARVLCI